MVDVGGTVTSFHITNLNSIQMSLFLPPPSTPKIYNIITITNKKLTITTLKKNPIYIKNISKIHKMMPGVTTRLEQHGVTPGYLLIRASLHQR